MSGIIAKSTITVHAPTLKVWEALITPEQIKEYMFGTTVESFWEIGDHITWSGEWEGKSYKDKGIIKEFEPEKKLQYTHFSALSGEPDVPENYHLVTIELEREDDEHTHVTLTQDNNKTDEEQEKSQKNWDMMLESLKNFVEK